MTQQCNPSPPNSTEVEALYPTGSAPEVRIPSFSAVCSYGHTQLTMQGALRQVLIQHFSDPRNILNATLRARVERDGVWSEGADTGIYIESLHRWRPELTESRPGIVLKDHKWTWQRMGIGDKYHDDYRSGLRKYGGYWNAAHTFFALANEGAEAQILATEVNKVMLWFAPQIMAELELQRFVPLEIGEVSALRESTENYMVPVSVAYVVPEFWSLQPDAPRLRRIVFRTSEVLKHY